MLLRMKYINLHYLQVYTDSHIFPSEAWEIAFAKICKRVPYSQRFFKMLPTCFTFDNIHTMKFQQLYIGRNIFLSVNALKYSNRSSTPFIIVLPKIRRKLSTDLFVIQLYQFAVYTKTGRQSRLPCNVLCTGSGFQVSCAYILHNKIFATVSAYRKLRALIGLILS